jgi:DNA-binding NarL/FixJ family response regulator
MSNERSATESSKISILICDDNEMIRDLLRTSIESRESLVVVGEAVDGIEAVRQASLLQPDIIILDLVMPERTGFEALPELRVVAPSADVIVYSGFAAASIAEHALALGATRYIAKGMHPDAINDAIEEVVQRRRDAGAQHS